MGIRDDIQARTSQYGPGGSRMTGSIGSVRDTLQKSTLREFKNPGMSFQPNPIPAPRREISRWSTGSSQNPLQDSTLRKFQQAAGMTSRPGPVSISRNSHGLTGSLDRAIGAIGISPLDQNPGQRGAALTSAHNKSMDRKIAKAVWEPRGRKFGEAVVRGAGSTAKGAYGLASNKTLHSGARATYGALNMVSKGAFGASIPQIGAVAGLGLLAYAAMSDNPVDGAKKAGGFFTSMGEAMAQSSRPSYGTTVFQQSTQGLTFGLHNNRLRQ